MRHDFNRQGGNMRRLLRWTFNFSAAVSAVLCVATCVIWARSYWATERFGFERGCQLIVTGLKGRIEFDCDWPALSNRGGFHVTWPESVSVGHGLDAFYFASVLYGQTRRVTIMVPYWAV